MTTFITYQIKASLCLIIFISIYYIFFRKETFYHFNRVYLIGALLVSLIMPLISISISSVEKQAFLPYVFRAVTISSRAPINRSSDIFTLINLVVTIYLAVAAFFSARFIYQVFRVFTVIKSGQALSNGNFRIITLDTHLHSYSFFNYLFISSDQLSPDNPVISHEMVHARQLHSIDILLIQLIKIFQWFNPFIYLTEKALQETHEYLADASVLEHTEESNGYKQLLLSQAFGIQPGIFSFFNYSLIKNRLTMMIKEKSPYRNRYKYLVIIPMLIFMGFIMCCKNSSKELLPPPPPPPPADVQQSADSTLLVDEQASFDGGTLEKFREWVQKNLVYPPKAVENGIFGKIIIQFNVNSQGKVADVKVLRGVDPLLDHEAIRVIMNSPQWKPAMKDDIPVTQQFTMPIIFQLQ